MLDHPAPPSSLDETVRLGTGERERHFRPLFDEYSPRVRRFFARHADSASEAEDLTQEVFLRVYRNGRSFMTSAEFEPWLFTVAANLARNAARYRRAEKRGSGETLLAGLDLTAGAGQKAVEQLSAEADPLTRTLDAEHRRLVGQALHELPDQMRRCAALRYQQDFRYQEIATLLSLSIDTVKSHLHSARRRLKTRLSPYFDNAPEEDPK
jgi:RNA polymerase sigma-70 factor, ECF subfamily